MDCTAQILVLASFATINYSVVEIILIIRHQMVETNKRKPPQWLAML